MIAALMAISGAISAYSSIQQGRQAAAMGKYNAAVSMENAKSVQYQADTELSSIRSKYRRLRGDQTAAAAVSGVAGGSFSDILTDSNMQEDLDSLGLLYKAKSNIQGYQNQASLSLAEGANARRQGMLNAAGTLIGSGAKVMGAIHQYPTLSDG